MSDAQKRSVLKKEEIKIRQSIGEAVPTQIFYRIAQNIKQFMEQKHFSSLLVNQTIELYELTEEDKLEQFIKKNPLNFGGATLSRIAELTNSQRENNSAYYTNKFILNEIYKELPEFDKDEIYILEPSVGVGNFLPFIFRKYEGQRLVHLDVADIDATNLAILKMLLEKQQIPENVRISYICDDSLLHDFGKRYDLVTGNPPFTKLKAKDAAVYLKKNINKATKNTFEFFLEKAISISDHVAMITPKAILNTPEFIDTRKMLAGMNVNCIQDYGENGFKGVLVETIGLFINTQKSPDKTKVISLTNKTEVIQKQSYIMDNHYPYWIIYRDEFFDQVSKNLVFDRFTVFRDRQITNANTTLTKAKGSMRVLKSRNISDDGKKVIDIPGYDAYIESSVAVNLSAYKFVGNDEVYLTPNMTYKPRVMKNQKDVLVNGSIAVLIPKEPMKLTEEQMEYFSTDEYRKFYQIARNYQTRSLNVDATSVFFYGVLKERANG